MSNVTQHIVKNADGTITMGTTQDVSSILDQNVFEATNNVNRKTDDTFGRKVASIPLNLINAWCKEWGCTMQQLMSEAEYKQRLFARLRDKDYLKLRTDTGRI
jgi:hypothetical protein